MRIYLFIPTRSANFATSKSRTMKALKEISVLVLSLTTLISFVLTAISLLTDASLRGYIFAGIFALSFSLLLALGLPNDESKGIIDYGRNDG